MVHHVVYLELNESVAAATLEEMVRASRTWLLKIPEVLSVRSGRNLDPESQWQFFYAIEVDSREKLKFVIADAFYLKFLQQFIAPNTGNRFSMDFELDPSRELKYS
ncbi:Dabb family protein [Luteolibacter algae]|uniref:Dabb family protein n=1 Tax=Luteolibacter algae TaxID=454151 RepID=A0ABW5D7C9_9BACT